MFNISVGNDVQRNVWNWCRKLKVNAIFRSAAFKRRRAITMPPASASVSTCKILGQMLKSSNFIFSLYNISLRELASSDYGTCGYPHYVVEPLFPMQISMLQNHQFVKKSEENEDIDIGHWVCKVMNITPEERVSWESTNQSQAASLHYTWHYFRLLNIIIRMLAVKAIFHEAAFESNFMEESELASCQPFLYDLLVLWCYC